MVPRTRPSSTAVWVLLSASRPVPAMTLRPWVMVTGASVRAVSSSGTMCSTLVASRVASRLPRASRTTWTSPSRRTCLPSALSHAVSEETTVGGVRW